MAVPLFLVAPDASVGWRVSHENAAESHSFLDKRLAIRYAREWADANRPSRVLVRDKHGGTEASWEYPPLFPDGRP
ncbi:MAG: DUF2188 domain-containing protein [Burkholderiales bacterium]